ncbi:MAG TPA: cytochrome c [Nitrospiraceae bacterium]|nr:cytochrome c [Nitrospiraceae bacterium]
MMPAHRVKNVGSWAMWPALCACACVLVIAPAGRAKEESAMPAGLQPGEAKFNANCARCHGERAAGTSQGPPLVHKIYEPNHHGDFAFQRAAANGVRAHHWKFGDMPKIEGVTAADVEQIIAYVRWLQRQAGIM